MVMTVLENNMKSRFAPYAELFTDAVSGLNGVEGGGILSDQRLQANLASNPPNWLDQAISATRTENPKLAKSSDEYLGQHVVGGQAYKIGRELARACEEVREQQLVQKSATDLSGAVYVGGNKTPDKFLSALLDYLDNCTLIRRGTERMNEVMTKLQHESQGLIQALQSAFADKPRETLSLLQKLANLLRHVDDNNGGNTINTNEDLMKTILTWMSGQSLAYLAEAPVK